MIGGEFIQALIEHRIVVFESVSLVYHKNRPIKAAQEHPVFQKNLICGYENVDSQVFTVFLVYLASELRSESIY